jgi:hypothetical protein
MELPCQPEDVKADADLGQLQRAHGLEDRERRQRREKRDGVRQGTDDVPFARIGLVRAEKQQHRDDGHQQVGLDQPDPHQRLVVQEGELTFAGDLSNRGGDGKGEGGYGQHDTVDAQQPPAERGTARPRREREACVSHAALRPRA